MARHEKRYCRQCGSPFVPRRKDQEFCSAKHNRRYRQMRNQIRRQRPRVLTHPCRWCGGPIIDRNADAEYCCDEHKLAHYAARQRHLAPVFQAFEGWMRRKPKAFGDLYRAGRDFMADLRASMKAAESERQPIPDME